MAVHPIPKGFHTVTPYLIITEAARAIEFYKTVFGAKEMVRVPGPNGTVGHAEIKIGDSNIMLADETKEMGWQSPISLGGTPMTLVVYVENVDEVFTTAVATGAIVKQPLTNQFYGDRTGMIEDPFGHVWLIATHIEDLSPEEIQCRAETWEKEITSV